MTSSAVLLVTVLLGAAPGPWKRLHEDQGAVVETAREGETTHVRTTATLPRPAAAVRAVLLDLERYPRWFRNLHQWRVLERGPSSARAWGRHDLPWPMDPRDYVVAYTWRDERDGALAIEARSASGGPAPARGVVRMMQVRSSWRVEPRGDGACLVVYTYAADIPGVPELFLRDAWKREGPALLRALSDEVGRRASPAAAP